MDHPKKKPTKPPTTQCKTKPGRCFDFGPLSAACLPASSPRLERNSLTAARDEDTAMTDHKQQQEAEHQHHHQPAMTSSAIAHRIKTRRQREKEEQIRQSLRYATWKMHLMGHRALLEGQGIVVGEAAKRHLAVSPTRSVRSSSIANLRAASASHTEEQKREQAEDEEAAQQPAPPRQEEVSATQTAATAAVPKPQQPTSRPNTARRRPQTATIRSAHGKDSKAILPFALTTVVRGEASAPPCSTARPASASTSRQHRQQHEAVFDFDDEVDRGGVFRRPIPSSSSCGERGPHIHRHGGPTTLHVPLRYVTVRPWNLAAGLHPERSEDEALSSLHATVSPRGLRFPSQSIPLLTRR